jgi:hypothetical protein
VNKQVFDGYFSDCRRGVALELDRFAPLTPSIGLAEFRKSWTEFSPPQSYRYVPDLVLRGLIARARPSPSTRQRVSARKS